MSAARNVVLYGKAFTTAHVFTHVVARLLATRSDDLAGYHFHCVYDDRRDAAEAAARLPRDRVTVHAQYEHLDPFREDLTWPPATVERWERQYGIPNLRRYVAYERVLTGRSDAEKWRYLLAHIEYFERLLEATDPVLYVSGAASTVHPWVALEIFRRRGVRCVSFFPTRFGETSFILDQAYESLDLRDSYKKIFARGLTSAEEAAAREVMDSYRKHAFKPVDFSYVNAMRTRTFPNPLAALRIAREYRTTDRRFYDEPFSTIALRALKARRTPLYDAWWGRWMLRRIDPDQPFFFLPLQYEPEMSLVTQGRGWVDQLELVRLISQSLPVDRWLYVKEHPNMLPGMRPARFYAEIVRLPRVRLLDRRLNSYAILPHAEAVLTITSTAGWEALMLDRPVGLFGHAFYEDFEEGVVQMTRPDDVPRTLRDFRDWKPAGDNVLAAYIVAVLERSKPGMIIEPRYLPAAAPRVLSDENLDNLGRVLLDALSRRAS